MDHKQARINVCNALNKLNKKENSFEFANYLSAEDQQKIQDLESSEPINTWIQYTPLYNPNTILFDINARLKEDIAFCLDLDKETILSSARFSNGSNHNPEKIVEPSDYHLHQDPFSISQVSRSNDTQSGIFASLAIVGPGTVFAEYNEDLYNGTPSWIEDINISAVENIVSPEEGQVAFIVNGPSGAIHDSPYNTGDRYTLFLDTPQSWDAKLDSQANNNIYSLDEM